MLIRTSEQAWLRSSLLWGVMQCWFVVGYQVFVRSIGPIFKGQAVQKPRTASPLKTGQIGCPNSSVTSYFTGCGTFKKSEDLIYNVAKAWNQTHISSALTLDLSRVKKLEPYCKMKLWNWIQDHHVKSIIQQEEESFHQKITLKFKEDSSKVLHLGHSFAWCWNSDTSKSRSEMPGKALKFGAGEGRKSVGPNMWGKKCYRESRRGGIS